ncbi:hypothetical protein FACS1894187_14660 [Synergistales bacterium]|nr:hypothetical protein FACS1894187_14660 [Synergistales bacterium]
MTEKPHKSVINLPQNTYKSVIEVWDGTAYFEGFTEMEKLGTPQTAHLKGCAAGG